MNDKISIKKQMEQLEIGQSISYPIRKMNSIRARMYQVKIMDCYNLTSKVDRASRTIIVTRLS